MITSNGTADRDTIKKEEKWKHKNIFLDTGHYFKMMIIKFATFFFLSLIRNNFLYLFRLRMIGPFVNKFNFLYESLESPKDNGINDE